jgi:hypothetical protein
MSDKDPIGSGEEVPKMQPVTQEEAPQAVPPDQAPEGPGAFKAMIGIITSPGETFKSLAARPSWAALVPLVLFLVAATAGAIALVHRVDMSEMARQQILRGSHASQMSQEQIEQAAEMGAKMGRIMSYATPITGSLYFLVIATIFWLVILAFGDTLSFADSLRVVCWSSVPKIVGAVLFIVVLFIKSPESFDPTNALLTNLGAAFGFERLGRPLFALLSDLDLITLWTLFLYTVGFAAFAKARVGKIAAIVFGLYGLYVLAHLGLAAIS